MSENDSGSKDGFECRIDGCSRTFSSRTGVNRHMGRCDAGPAPWRDTELLQHLHHDKGLSQRKMAAEIGCTKQAIVDAMEALDVERRSNSEAKRNHGRRIPPAFHTNKHGYEYWITQIDGKTEHVAVHRLLAVCKYGFDKLDGKVVHHAPVEIGWANWEENIQLMENGEHTSHHHRIDEDDLLQSVRDVADELGRRPTVREMENLGRYSSDTCKDRFGSWSDVLQEAGVTRGSE